MFPSKQKFHATAAFLDNPNFLILSSLDVFLPLLNRPGVKKVAQWTIKKRLELNIFIMKKKNCRDIKFLLNGKHLTQFSGT